MSLAGQNIDRFTSNLNTQLSIYLSLPICFDVNSWGGAFKSANAKSVRLFHMLGRFCCVFFWRGVGGGGEIYRKQLNEKYKHDRRVIDLS